MNCIWVDNTEKEAHRSVGLGQFSRASPRRTSYSLKKFTYEYDHLKLGSILDRGKKCGTL